MHCVEQFKVRFEEFAYALCREAGKPIKDARGEVTRLIDTFEIAAEEAVRLYGEYAPLDISERNKGIQSIVRRFPIGVVSMVSPFNFPLNLAAHKIAPAIAAGCPFVLKPASKTPIGALMIAECLASCADFPKGACSVVTCDRKVGDMFVQDERLKVCAPSRRLCAFPPPVRLPVCRAPFAPHTPRVAPPAPVVHGLAVGGVGHEGALRQEEGRARARRQRRVHRRLVGRSDAGDAPPPPSHVDHISHF